MAELPCVFRPEVSLVQALDDLCGQAIELVRNGARILLLSDRSASRGDASGSDGDGHGSGASGAGFGRVAHAVPGWRLRPAIAATFIMPRC